jgi:hypothetical protein
MREWMDRGLPLILVIALSFMAARADRPVTADEQAGIVAALEAEACSGGTYEFDDEDDDGAPFEVDDAQCGDGI